MKNLLKQTVAALAIGSVVMLGVSDRAIADSGPKSSPTTADTKSRATLKVDAEKNQGKAKSALKEASDSESDAELAAFLLIAKGPIANRNPETKAAAEKQISGLDEVSDDEAIKAAQEYVDWSDEFSSKIRPGVLSDDPIKVDKALENLSADFIEYAEAKTGEQIPKRVDPQCDGSVCVKQTALAITTVAGVWQVAGVHTAAAVTIAAAAAVIVTLYLPGSPEMNDVDRQQYVNDFMDDVRR